MPQKCFLVKIREIVEIEREVWVYAEDRVEAREKALAGQIFAPATAKSKIKDREFVGFSGSSAMEAVREDARLPLQEEKKANGTD